MSILWRSSKWRARTWRAASKSKQLRQLPTPLPRPLLLTSLLNRGALSPQTRLRPPVSGTRRRGPWRPPRVTILRGHKQRSSASMRSSRPFGTGRQCKPSATASETSRGSQRCSSKRGRAGARTPRSRLRPLTSGTGRRGLCRPPRMTTLTPWPWRCPSRCRVHRLPMRGHPGSRRPSRFGSERRPSCRRQRHRIVTLPWRRSSRMEMATCATGKDPRYRQGSWR